MDRGVMMREAFGVREACFRFAMKSLKPSDEPYVHCGSSPPKMNAPMAQGASHFLPSSGIINSGRTTF